VGLLVKSIVRSRKKQNNQYGFLAVPCGKTMFDRYIGRIYWKKIITKNGKTYYNYHITITTAVYRLLGWEHKELLKAEVKDGYLVLYPYSKYLEIRKKESTKKTTDEKTN